MLAATWWRRGDRRVLLAAYGMLLLGTLFVAYLTYLELFVIEAICLWCASFAITIVVSLVIAGVGMRRSSRPASLDLDARADRDARQSGDQRAGG